jgi:hypothetical protein
MINEPRPPQAMAVTLKVKETQEHLLRRLGQAVVLQWEELPFGLQDVLIDQAVLVTDRDAASQSEIETFIRGVRSVPIAKATPETETPN